MKFPYIMKVITACLSLTRIVYAERVSLMFENSEGACPGGWTCTGSAKAGGTDHSGLGNYQGEHFFNVGENDSKGTGISKPFMLPKGTTQVRFKRAGGADNGGLRVYRASDNSVICSKASRDDTNVFFEDFCIVDGYSEEDVYMYVWDCQGGGWGKTFIDEIHFIHDKITTFTGDSIQVASTTGVPIPGGCENHLAFDGEELGFYNEPLTSAPSTFFQGLNFSINEPKISFHDFFLNFTYAVGRSTEETNFTLYRENCTSTDDVSDIVNIAHEGKEDLQVSIIKTAIGQDSSLVTPSGGIEGYSKGSIKFCIKVETLLGETSVTFRKTNVVLSYDLTDNAFEVVGNTISANEIGEEETEVTTKYGVEACICKENFTCETSSVEKVFEQNKLIYICVYPNNTSKSTQISNFDMKFEQEQVTTYTAVRTTEDGPVATAGLSYIKGDGDLYFVASRLITALFEGGKNSFDVVGNAQLKFKTRQLKKEQSLNLRSMEEKSIGTDGEESQFKMKVTIAKAVDKVSSTESNSTSGAMILVLGGFLVLSIMFGLFKKMKNSS